MLIVGLFQGSLIANAHVTPRFCTHTLLHILLFAGFLRSFWCFVTLYILSTCGKTITFHKRRLKSIPTNIPPDTTQLIIRYDNIIPNIPAHVFAHLTALTSLEVLQSNVRFVADGAFSGLRALTTLRLSSNKIRRLPDLREIADTLTILTLDHNPIVLEDILERLTPLAILEELSLRSCTLSGLTSIPVLSNLKKLWLDGNNINQLNSAFITALVNLELFHVANNQLTHMDFTAFPNSLNDLNYYDNRISPITSANMSAVAGLKAFACGKNIEVSSLVDQTFADLDFLASLGLQHLGLTIVPDLSDVADTLTHLYLDNNAITLNNTYNLYDLNELRVLSLHHCRLSGNLTLPTFSLMTHLYLNDNQLTRLSPNIFQGYTSLYRLDLQNNQINALGIPTDFPTTLRHLDLSANLITLIPNGTFSEHRYLTFLYVRGNALPPLQKSTFQGLVSLIRLDLTNSDLSALERATFQDQARLTHLYLNNNRLTTLVRETFLGLGSLIYLFLHENAIREIEEGAFRGLYKLQTLYLQSNALVTFPEMTDSADSLIYLYVNNNPQMIYMNASHLVNFNSLKYLYVHSCSLGGDLDLPLLPALFKLDARSNKFTGISPRLFRGFNNLNYVDLRWNRFVKLPLFEDSSGASDIELNGQNPTHVGFDISVTLNLEGNRIQTIPAASISLLTRGLIRLKWNPIDCDSLCWMFDCRNRTFHASNVDLPICVGHGWDGILWTSPGAAYLCPRKLGWYVPNTFK